MLELKNIHWKTPENEEIVKGIDLSIPEGKLTVITGPPSLTVNTRQNSRKTCVHGLCGCLLVCIDMYYIFDFVLFVFFVFEIIPRMEAFDINSKSVLKPNVL